MFKKTLLPIVALAAFGALALPSVAGAQTLTDKAGVVEVESEVEMVGNDVTTTTALGTLSCASVLLTGTVGVNGPTTSTIDSVTGTTSGCLLGGSLPIPTTNLQVADIHITEGGVGTTSGFTFLLHIAGNECHISGSPGVTYSTNTDVIKVNGNLTSPTCGPILTHGEFTLRTKANIDPISID